MQKWTKILLVAITAALLLLAASCSSTDTNAVGYAADRAQIEDLQARYMFALDFHDYDTYVSTFTEDGILDIRNGNPTQGREAIKELLGGMPSNEEGQAPKEPQGPYPATGRHNITNIVLKIDGDKAQGRAYWFHYGNNNPERKAEIDSYGHYEDEMVKENGKWLFKKRVIYNEQVADWIAPPGNRCW